MLTKVFVVFDSATKAYMTPFFMHSRGQAIRAFTDTVNDPATIFARHAADFTLFELGTYEDENASFVIGTHVNLGKAIEFLDPAKAQASFADLPTPAMPNKLATTR